MELRKAGGVVGEVKLGELDADGCGCGGDGARGVEHELPLALIPEEAECAPSAEECHGEDDGECFEDPAWIDQVWRRGLRSGAALR